jgi:hypothetical protein
MQGGVTDRWRQAVNELMMSKSSGFIFRSWRMHACMHACMVHAGMHRRVGHILEMYRRES